MSKNFMHRKINLLFLMSKVALYAIRSTVQEQVQQVIHDS